MVGLTVMWWTVVIETLCGCGGCAAGSFMTNLHPTTSRQLHVLRLSQQEQGLFLRERVEGLRSRKVHAAFYCLF